MVSRALSFSDFKCSNCYLPAQLPISLRLQAVHRLGSILPRMPLSHPQVSEKLWRQITRAQASLPLVLDMVIVLFQCCPKRRTLRKLPSLPQLSIVGVERLSKAAAPYPLDGSREFSLYDKDEPSKLLNFVARTGTDSYISMEVHTTAICAINSSPPPISRTSRYTENTRMRCAK